MPVSFKKISSFLYPGKSVTHFCPEFCTLGKNKLSGLIRLNTSYHLFPINLSQLPDDRPHRMSMCLEGRWVWAGGGRLLSLSPLCVWGGSSKVPYGQTVIDRCTPSPTKKEERIWEGCKTYH